MTIHATTSDKLFYDMDSIKIKWLEDRINKTLYNEYANTAALHYFFITSLGDNEFRRVKFNNIFFLKPFGM